MIKELTSLQDDWCIKVRIIRLWKLMAFKNPLETWKIEMVLQDEEIVATVKESICPKFEKYLEEGKCFYISTFFVGDSEGTPRIVENKNKIHFIRLPMSLHVTVTVDQCRDLDLIGDLISCGTIAHATVDGNRRPFIRLELEDLTGTKLRNITLWGDYALQLNNALGDRQNLGHVVIILQFMKHKIYKRRPAVSSMFGVSKLLIENRSHEGDDHCVTHLTTFSSYSIKNDFLNKLPKVCINDIRDIGILGYEVHYNYPPVERLPFHLPGEQQVVYDADADIDDVLNKSSVASSKFLAWMKCNETDDVSQTLTYADFPTKFVWKSEKRMWEWRKQGYAVGRIHQVPLSLDKLLRRNGSSLSSISGMPLPDLEFLENHINTLIHDEICYNPDLLREEHERLFPSLTAEQKIVYTRVISAVENNKGGFFFLYGYGGTGKTYIWKTLSAAIRSKGEIVLNVASSGIASLLLTGGRTAHSRFGIPINVNEDSFCSITAGTDLAALLIKMSLIIWDKAPMMHKHCFEALDRSLRDIIGSTNPKAKEMPFGGKVIIFGGDFRQILPVIPGGTRQDVVHTSLNSLYIWDDCTVLELTTNMRLREGFDKSNIEEIKEFGDWILKMGNGRLGGPNDGEATVDILDDIIISDNVDPIASLIEFINPSLLDNLQDTTFFQERAILAPTHEVVGVINDRLLSQIPGEDVVYYSSDSICESEGVDNTYTESLYSPEVLNGLKLSGN
ncbi:ATP-dependent DNA helicase PIF1-like protein [Tanacetum coccineum]